MAGEVNGIEFKPWGKTPRLYRPITITEKIDGTNAAIIITDDLRVGAQSRNRLITPADDNYGFAKWVQKHAEKLAALLGPGHHYGEWWGHGIQRGYGLPKGERRLSLFNVNRYLDHDFSEVEGLGTVPLLGVADVYSDGTIKYCLELLQTHGSPAGKGFKRPEGIIVFMQSSQQVYKVLLEDDHLSKTTALEGI